MLNKLVMKSYRLYIFYDIILATANTYVTNNCAERSVDYCQLNQTTYCTFQVILYLVNNKPFQMTQWVSVFDLAILDNYFKMLTKNADDQYRKGKLEQIRT